RTGSFIGNDSGEITLAFSRANQIEHSPRQQLMTRQAICDDQMDRYVRMTVSAVEEGMLSSLVHDKSTIDRKVQERLSLKDVLTKHTKQACDREEDVDTRKKILRLCYKH